MAMNGRVDFPKKELAHQCPGSALGRPGGWAMASPGYSALPQELLTGSGAQAAPGAVVGGHERAAGGDGCHAFACGLVETSAATRRGPRRAITDGGHRGARPQSPSA